MERFKEFQRRKDRYLASFLIIFVAGYFFFFTSKLWMPPDAATVPPTEAGNTITLNDRKVTLVSWLYDEEQRLMEVQVEITNTAVDGINRYKWTAVELNKGLLKVAQVIEESSFVVVHIKDIPKRWEEISLRMGIKSEDEIKIAEFSDIKLYADKKSVKEKSIKELTLTEYKKEGCLSKIETYEKRIKELKSLINKEEKTIAEGDSTIEDLEEQKKYQTSTEITETDKSISEVRAKIDISKSAISQYQVEMKDIENKIVMQKEIYDSL